MNDYFNTVVNRLTIEDLNILGILYENNATKNFTSVSNKEIFERSNLPIASFRKAISRLVATHLIETVTGQKTLYYRLTDYGIKASELIRRECE